MKRSNLEILFIILFMPTIFGFYSIYKYPDFFVSLGVIDNVKDIYFFGKNPSFWYSSLYTFIVCFISFSVLYKNTSPYKLKKTKLSKYQKYKFLSIFFCQLIFFYIIPYILPFIINGKEFFNDPITSVYKDNYIYVFRGFTSWGGFIYIFLVVPLFAWLLGKRYCSWFCACGNLAETVGITKWGSKWVKDYTPRGENSKKLEILQTLFLIFGICFGVVLLLDIFKIITSNNLVSTFRFYQDFVVDFIFGSLIGVGAYPFLGTRVWCRYGCPLAKLMELTGKYTKSKFKITSNEKCKGVNLCSKVCPMGIDVASFAHDNKKPLNGSFGLDNTCCIGCGGCIDICPFDALEFKKIKIL
jgi:ferredoxin-type protein NapH